MKTDTYLCLVSVSIGFNKWLQTTFHEPTTAFKLFIELIEMIIYKLKK